MPCWHLFFLAFCRYDDLENSYIATFRRYDSFPKFALLLCNCESFQRLKIHMFSNKIRYLQKSALLENNADFLIFLRLCRIIAFEAMLVLNNPLFCENLPKYGNAVLRFCLELQINGNAFFLKILNLSTPAMLIPGNILSCKHRQCTFPEILSLANIHDRQRTGAGCRHWPERSSRLRSAVAKRIAR